MIREFFQAVYDAPNDDTVRLVLADALQQLGDPRGEFIMLQFDGSARARKRADKLLQRHVVDFLGPLADGVRHELTRWEKGFLVECVTSLPEHRKHCPEWATVQKVMWMWQPRPPVMLASPWLKSLTEVRVVTDGLQYPHDPTAIVRPVVSHRPEISVRAVGHLAPFPSP